MIHIRRATPADARAMAELLNTIIAQGGTTALTDPIQGARPFIEAATPMGRFGEPDDIAWAAVYLASDESAFMTGQTLSPNGGYHMSQ